jgi:hypothetical protein
VLRYGAAKGETLLTTRPGGEAIAATRWSWGRTLLRHFHLSANRGALVGPIRFSLDHRATDRLCADLTFDVTTDP